MLSSVEKAVYYRKDAWLACGIVACTFFYFLLFAQFALLHRIEELDAEKRLLQPVMMLMGGGGLVGSFVGWRLFSAYRLRTLLLFVFSTCALLAVAAGNLSGIEWFLGIGFGVGVFLGMLTVVVVPSLRLLIPQGKIGIFAGWGTGLAYFASNVPALFQQTAAMQCYAAAGVGLLGVGFTLFMPKDLRASRLAENSGGDSTPFAFWPMVLLFFVLVWLDSAAFYAIQETDGLKDETWGTPLRLWGNAAIHLVFGVVSGALLDRGFLKGVLVLAMTFLVAGCLWLRLGYGGFSWAGAGIYVAGVSLYSTGLVAMIAQFGDSRGSWTMAKRAAVLFAVAGWIGSGLGIGMARDLGTVPYAFLAIASVTTAGALLLMARAERKGV